MARVGYAVLTTRWQVSPWTWVNSATMSRRRPVLVLSACLALFAGGVANAASSSRPTPATLVPALGSAAAGGAVIVELRDEHANLNLRTQGAARAAAAFADQKAVVADIVAHRGTGVLQLVSVDAVAATLSGAEVRRLRAFPGVKEIVPDPTIVVGDPESPGRTTTAATTLDPLALQEAGASTSAARTASTASAAANPFTRDNSCGTSAHPLTEPEALSLIKAPAMTDRGLATEPGYGVVVANGGLNTPPVLDLVGNPNFHRPAVDGGGSVVADAVPGDTTDSTDGEYYGDASSIAAQGTVEYQYAKELPYSHLPTTCYFKIVGDAPGATLVDTNDVITPTAPGVTAAGTANHPADEMTVAQELAGIDGAVITAKADVINESYGYSTTPGEYALFYGADDAAVAAGVTVVVSAGDSGDSGTVSSPATDPNVIAVGATNALREASMAYGFSGWVNNDVTPLSSGGTPPNNRLVDLVAPGYGGEAACNPDGSDCPTNTQTEAFGGTSESAPLVAGAAADVIEAYRQTHGGDSPTPAMVKEILTSTATDIDAPADQQGAGLVDIAAAVAAARQTPASDATGGTDSLLVSPTQLDVQGSGGSSSAQSVTVYNTAAKATTVSGTYRAFGAEKTIGRVVTENVSAPAASAAVPADGATAARSIRITVPGGLARLDADMIWPDASNGNVLNFVLVDPQGRLRQLSYDYGAAASDGTAGSVPDIQHVEVAEPDAGVWTVEIKWANGRSHLQEAPNVPSGYRGTLQFRLAGQDFVTARATAHALSIPAHGSVTVPLAIALPKAPGDHPEAVQFSAPDGAAASLPVARRTLVPSTGGAFTATITSTVGRGVGEVTTFVTEVPANEAQLHFTFSTPDASADDGISVYVVDPTGTAVVHLDSGGPETDWTLSPTTQDGHEVAASTFTITDPLSGRYEVDVMLNLTTSGREFTQPVTGQLTVS
jgi:hypothetical protein